MNLLIISDLHIGNNDHFETFGWKSEQFIAALKKVIDEEKIDRVILNGDIFELYKYSFDEIYNRNKSLIDFLLNSPYFIYLKGNHDAICRFGLTNTEIENSHGQKIYIEHGHSADFLNGTKLGRKLQIFGFNILRWMSTTGWVRRIYFKIVELDEAINSIPKKYHSIRYLTHALRLLKDYDMVVLGHTHKIEAHKTYYLNNKKQYINSGSCSMGRFQGVIINTESLKFETLKFKNFKDLMKEYKKPVIREFALIA
jgi:predicted phosphodiesterase